LELLFKREQTTGKTSKVNFKLWGKIELAEDELALIKRYRFDEAILIGADDTQIWRSAVKFGIGAFLIAALVFAYLMGNTAGVIFGLMAGAGAGYWRMNEQRETVFVKDLLHGRNFTCASVVDLAKKEAWLEGACEVFRQVMESAKHWDGTERHTIEALPREQAKELILRAY
jgi:hypothetical protein